MAANFSNAPLIAYSGELDKQKQAADIMAKFLLAENIDLVHVIGPQTGHKIHPDSMVEIERRLNQIAVKGRNPLPTEVSFVTYFLRYNRMHWVQVDRMETQWEPARVMAEITKDLQLSVKTSNVAALTLDLPSGGAPFDVREKVRIRIDGQDIVGPSAASDRSWRVTLVQQKGQWTLVKQLPEVDLVKKHGLSGPIDDAFMDAFLFVSPSGKAMNDMAGAWAKAEMERAAWEWRRQFRGTAPTKLDKDIKDADLAAHNLILWGDPKSNAILAKIIDKLPIKWTADKLIVNDVTYTAADHVPILIFPNPLNPQKYVVINSSFTYREYDYLNNARQVPKLPDWAVVDLKTPPDAQKPGAIVDAGFFDESWGYRVK